MTRAWSACQALAASILLLAAVPGCGESVTPPASVEEGAGVPLHPFPEPGPEGLPVLAAEVADMLAAGTDVEALWARADDAPDVIRIGDGAISLAEGAEI